MIAGGMCGVPAYRQGMNQAWHSGQKEVKIQLTDRVVLSPFAAKRISIMLNNIMQDYEKRYGKLTIEIRRPPRPGAPIS
jgi:hypothetical protein